MARGERIWRVRVRAGRTRFRRSSMVAWCNECSERGGYRGGEFGPCAACGREVVNTEPRPRIHFFCSERCQADFYAARQRERRRGRRAPRPCASCGGGFTPARLDARYCSNACRQREYRRRKSRFSQGGP